MKCENNFCVYQTKGTCRLKTIRLDNTGMCTECIQPTIDKNILKQAKQEFLQSSTSCSLDFNK